MCLLGIGRVPRPNVIASSCHMSNLPSFIPKKTYDHPRKDFGHPLTRRRLYIVLVREELMITKAKSNFLPFCKQVVDLMRNDPTVTWRLGF